ncbi:MAG TPA: hypothetical protein IGS37_04815 [Synechococcales cyanobacterium M55_K2018_004]|nr:hypothetical protein [Synechococcales cyanobacterium M55_K2018_004]
MMGAGFVSASLGYALGREALKGITQPDLRPTAVGEANKKKAAHQAMMIVPEEKILADVQARISGKPASPAAVAPVAPSPTPQVTPPSNGNFPISSEVQGVTLQVLNAQKQGDVLLLNVSLQNSSNTPVKFLYSSLSLTDNQGKMFNANTEGLPGELPPGGEVFAGTISIPLALLAGSETLSLTLMDYPDQQLKFELSGIPVVR